MEWSDEVQFSPTKKHDIRSISKSVTSLLVGTAVSEDRFPSLDSPVIDCFPEYADLRTRKNERITFRHLLTMSHGLRWDESRGWKSQANNERQLLEAVDPSRYVLEQRVASPPGTAFNYSGGATTLLAAAVAKAAGRSFDVYAKDRLFAPLGITDVEWLSFTGCAEVAAFAGLRLRPRDLAKLGQLMVDQGRWNGRQILPARRRVDDPAHERGRTRRAVLRIPLVAGALPAQRSRPDVDRRLRQWRPTSFRSSPARSRGRHQRVRSSQPDSDRDSQPARDACCD
jgi:CubicO group peptidase (beta-lactamase class C family)